MNDIVKRFFKAMDPEYDGHRLLEQYSAQVCLVMKVATEDVV